MIREAQWRECTEHRGSAGARRRRTQRDYCCKLCLGSSDPGAEGQDREVCELHDEQSERRWAWG